MQSGKTLIDELSKLCNSSLDKSQILWTFNCILSITYKGIYEIHMACYKLLLTFWEEPITVCDEEFYHVTNGPTRHHVWTANRNTFIER